MDSLNHKIPVNAGRDTKNNLDPLFQKKKGGLKIMQFTIDLQPVRQVADVHLKSSC